MSTLEKGAAKSNMVECSGPNCNKKISKLTAVPVRNIVVDKVTKKQKELSPKKWLCDSCFKDQHDESLKKEGKDLNPMRHLKVSAPEKGEPFLYGSSKDMLNVFKDYAEKQKKKPAPSKQEPPHPAFKELISLAAKRARGDMEKQDATDHPDHIKNIMSRHKGIIPSDHRDRETMAAYVNKLHFSPGGADKAEAKRLYDLHISGGGAYTKAPTLQKNNIYAQTYSDGSIDVIFDEDVSNILEKTIVTYLESQGYEEFFVKGLKAKHKSKKGGMTEAGVKAYRRENPGSKLQTAVTEDKPSGKRAKRRRSFCARMSGVKGPMKDKHGKPTRKALALRRWKC